MVITKDDLAEAIQKCDDIEGEISNIFKDAAGDVSRREHPAIMLGIIEQECQKYGRLAEVDLYRFFKREMDYGELQNAMKFLISGGFVMREQEGGKTWIRLPTLEDRVEQVA